MHARRGFSLTQFALKTSALLALVWAIGLVGFVASLPKVSAGPQAPADGIVVYTGGRGARTIAGMELFASGGGERLLISGVNPETSRARLAELWAGDSSQFDCCVDLGREALTTEGNALEAAQWVNAHEFASIILITSDYHMPRARAATKLRMPKAMITPYVVSSGLLGDNGRPDSLTAWRHLAGEYTKYLLVQLRAKSNALFG